MDWNQLKRVIICLSVICFVLRTVLQITIMRASGLGSQTILAMNLQFFLDMVLTGLIIVLMLTTLTRWIRVIANRGLEQQAAKWQVAVNHFPDLADIEIKLRAISDKLVADFRVRLLDTKNFSDRKIIAEQLKMDFLSASFGRNPEILQFGQELLLSGNQEAARELCQTIAVLGDTTEPNLIIDRIRRKFLDKR